ncbi:kinetochore protein nuf2 [Ascosphaera apis ARSEF 7405]|uniref:Probable kinetochore protein NUF2 n=1 Tax=Ascosphaera apis ARSEF 7405 TaxID=392613 RepID=A0A167X0U5_9EURO|nr:kinetochore protein nuf2 [Ascosphaera apis ARSEF 7405]
MSYNHRMSQQFHGGRGSHNRDQHGRHKRKVEDESDALMRLPDKEIAGCINDIGIPFSVTDLLKPNAQQIQMVFEWFAELLMNTTRETVDPAMRAAAEDASPDYADIFSNDTRNLMGFFVSLRRLMVECGVNDFTFTDLTRPTYERIVKIFSYLINFVRFRESQTTVIDEHFNKGEQTKARIETLYSENQEMEERIDEIKQQQAALESQVKQKTKRNDALKMRLLELRREQERVAETFERIKAENAKKQATLEEKTERLVKTRQENEKLRPYVLQSPVTLQNSLTELTENLAREKARLDQLERRTRALQASMDTFNVVGNDVQGCIKALEDVAEELRKEEEEDARAVRNRDALAERGNTVREVAQTEKLLQRQLARWQERIDALKKSSREKGEQAQKRMTELREVQKQLREERAEKQRDMERRRIRIEQTEKKMIDLKENIEAEVQAAHAEYLKLESHIKLYITEMEKCLE